MSFIIRVFFVAVIVIAGCFSVSAEDEKHHALSLIRMPKYPADYKHFDYVNPDAPKGGTVKLASPATYDNLNPAIFRGALAPGLSPLGASFLNDSLMILSEEEPETSYCLLCEWVSFPSDYSSATFKLRDGAKWHDGTPITVDDVIFSLDSLKARDPQTGLPYQPQIALYYKNVVRAEKTGDREVTFTFDVKGNRELPVIIGELAVLPKHYWTGNGPDGKPRDVTKSTLEPPVGSGPYKIKSLQPGSAIAFERVPDYWGANLPVRIGTNNFNEIQFQYYGDQSVAMEAFKSGQYDFKDERSAKSWATAYDFPALNQGRVVKRDDIVLKRPHPTQGFALNLRRSQFQDVRLRKALNLAFDFEWANQNLFYNSYKRTSSYFEGQELAATGLPSPAELKLLEPLRDKIPTEVFTQEYKNPVNAAPTDYRTHLREAARLLKEAGWDVVDGQLKNAAGQPFPLEFLIDSEQFQRVILPYVESLRRLGINATVRQVDSTEEKRREDNFDFDVIVQTFPESQSPGNEQRDYWGSQAADQPGSRNVLGIKNPAVDALVDKIIFATNRDDLVVACHALDRVLLWNHYIVPQWYLPNERIAYWNKFGSPNPLPPITIGFPNVWWFDAALAQKNGLK